jgi:hypothetical protein
MILNKLQKNLTSAYRHSMMVKISLHGTILLLGYKGILGKRFMQSLWCRTNIAWEGGGSAPIGNLTQQGKLLGK